MGNRLDRRASDPAARPAPGACLTLLLTLVLGVAGTVALYQVLCQWEDSRLDAAFEDVAGHSVGKVQAAQAANLLALQSVSALYAGSEEVERQEFGEFVWRFLPRFNGLEAIAWAPRVSSAERDAREKAAAEAGHPGFQFTERGDDGRLRAARARAAYYPAYFLEPYAGNETFLGFDLASHPVAWEAMRWACDTARTTATSRMSPAEGGPKPGAILVFQAIYRKGEPCRTPEQRWESIAGFACAVLDLPDLLSDTLAPLDAGGLDVSVWDPDGPEGRQYLGHVSLGPEAGMTPPPSHADAAHAVGPRLVRTIPVAGRKWEVVCTPSEAWLADHREWFSVVALLAGLLATGLLVAHFRSTLHRTAKIEQLAAQLAGANRDLEALASRDELTGLWNRRQFITFLTAEVARTRRHGGQVALAMIDVDVFKGINDTRGHAFGDHVLKAVAQILASDVRTTDIVGRYGGDEFMILMPETPAEGAACTLERIRRRIAGQEISDGTHTAHATISAGIAASRPGVEVAVESLVRESDEALYVAKRAGRDCTRRWDEACLGQPAEPHVSDAVVDALR